jgi:curved DNA-binding protein CbpA
MSEYDAKVDYYEVLGVATTASVEDIKAAYRRLVIECHPDKQPGSGDRFRQINEAWEVLRDPVERQRYDEARRALEGPTIAGAVEVLEHVTGRTVDQMIDATVDLAGSKLRDFFTRARKGER